MTSDNIERLYELSPMQQGMLFHTLYAPHSGVYIEQFVCMLEGPVDGEIFAAAWRQCVLRHAPLRTAFLWEDLDEPLQVVYRSVPLPWQEQDWRALAASEQRSSLEALLASDRARGFDLGQAPLLRLRLLRLSSESCYFICTYHHILLDGWSLVQVLQEVFSLYDALRCGQRPLLASRRPFEDYIAWLRQRKHTEAEAFWRAYLQGFTLPTPLPSADQAGQAGDAALLAGEEDSGLAGGYLHGGRPVRLRGFTLSSEEAKALRHCARSSQLTVNTLLQGAWALLLSHYSGEQDIVFGATVAGRPADLPGSEHMIGLFINTLPVRCRILPQTELRAWLRLLQEQQAEARQYDYSPLVQIQGWSEVPRNLPLFESLFVFENYPLDTAPGDGEKQSLRIAAVQTLEQTNYPLVLIVGPTGAVAQALRVQLGYETARFSPAVIERMLRHLRSILHQVARHPTGRLGDITLIEEGEEARPHSEWSALQADDSSLTITEAIRRQALHAPERVALVCAEQTLTYGELELSANRLARTLRDQGIANETCVAVCLDRSVELAIALPGILKAGGTYLPLDPGFPPERLALLLAETRAPLVLTQPKYRRLFAALDTQVCCLEFERPAALDGGNSPPASEIAPAQAAYVIYTSGSTGRPKGVVVSHRALLNHALAVGTAYELRERERVLQFASSSFDVSLEEFLPAWLHGASVVMWPEALPPSASEFSAFTAREALAVLNLPSSYWHEWVLELARSRATLPSSLRLVVIGSERASATRLALWQRAVGERVALRNAYGLTETTITALLYAPDRLFASEETRPVPVGRPLANIEAYVLDEHRRPVPPGLPGELYIGGTCLGRGYLADTALTAERFVPHPFSLTPGARLFRTGDRARSLPGGVLEVLGRCDGQVKIRGFRIEPGEVEARILQHPSVREALVLAREDTPGEPALVAYVVVDEAGPGLAARLRQHLQRSLPPYMIPSFFMPLDALPRTSGGKIHARLLPAPQQALTRSDAYIPPRTPVEEMLAAIWCDVLRLEFVGRCDHFFKLGGHSLQATQVVARLRETLRVELAVRALYDAPTIAALAARIEQERQRATGLPLPVIEPSERTVPPPLSFAQQRLWFLDQFQPGNPFYTLPGVLYLRGALDVAALERSLQALVQRHETLRTTFALHGNEPAQMIAPALRLSLPVAQLSETAGLSSQEELISELARTEARQPFDLERGPLIRTLLLRLNPQEHVLFLTLHHIVADGWAMEILLQELSAIYTAQVNGQPATLPALPIQYADYAAWQRSWLRGEVLDQQMAYWRNQLEGAPAYLQLPTDRARPAVQTYNGALYTFYLPPSLLERLHTLSREEGVTLFMTLLAAFQALLFRQSNQTDIVVGTPTSGRVHAATENVVGLFLNMLALRTRLSADLSFRDLLARVRETTLGAYAHQDVPFEKVVEELQPERSLSYSPLFQVMLVLQNMPISAIALPGLSLEVFSSESRTAKFDLTLGMRETPQGLHCVAEYNTDLFDEATIARMAEHFRVLLEGCTAASHLSLADLPLLTPAERRQMLEEWNAEAQELDALFVHRLVERWALATPDALAVTCADASLTYAELDQRANRLAWHLQSLGVGPDTLAGLFLARSIDQIVAILAILKAGGAYVPLDPAHPQDHLAYLLADSSISVLVVHEVLRPRLPATAGLIEVLLDDEQAQQRIKGYPAVPPPAHVQPEHLAYVIYTSGSTGRPKGVMVTHRGVCNFAQALAHRFGEQAGARVLQWISLSFDASLSEIATTFSAGALLCLGDRALLQQGEELLAFLEREAITTLSIVPSVLALLLPQALPHLHIVAVGAEPFSGELVARWSAGRRFFNNYGPTEATVTATVAECRGGESPSIGTPLANIQVYLLDTQQQPVPIGTPGEIYIGGLGLARGYHRQPALTAERFVPHPFSTRPGMRLYRTGDLARYRSDGSIEFLGRVDRQIKLRGYRVEPGEIEATLDQHPAVRASTVLAREDLSGERLLVAYVVPAPGISFSPAQVRAYLRQQLPAHMIPAAIVSLPELPRTANGKLDYVALAASWHPEPQEPQVSPPQTPLQDVLATIWSELLHREQIDVTQNFFELGGHSLLATQVVSRIRELFRIDFPLRALFEAPTLVELAAQVEQALLARHDLAPSEVVPIPRVRDLPLSFAQQRLWFLDQLDPGSPVYNLPLAMRLRGRLDARALEGSVRELQRRHESLRTIFENREGQPVQVLMPAGQCSLRYVDLRELQSAARNAGERSLAQQEARLPFELSQGPLMRATVLLLAPDEYVLLLSLHHIISDGRSMEILVRDLLTLYTAYTRNESPQLPALPFQYVDYAAWQRDRLRGETLAAHIDYWRRQLENLAVLELPTDRPRPPLQTDNGATRALRLPQALSQQLQTLSLYEGTTLFMSLLAAFQILLARYSGQEDIAVGSPIANRNHTGTEHLIGFFVNTLVLRTNLSESRSFREVLRRVRAICLEAYTHQDLPFEQLVESLQPERDLSRSPLFQVMFAFHRASPAFQQLEESASLTIDVIEEEQVTAKFDLSLDVTETAQGLYCSAEYNTDLFEGATIERLLKHWHVLLEGLVSSPESPWRELPLLREEEYVHVLTAWSTAEAVQPQISLLDLFAARVAAAPQAPAVLYEGRRLSYGQLDAEANRLARYLQSWGIGPEDRVGICLPRSVELIVSLLAVWKAGAAYVPLDASLPAERLAFMLNDAGVAVLLTEQGLAQSLDIGAVRLLCLDSCAPEIARCPAGAPVSSVHPSNLAYLIYTSGSTGFPKGAMITHANLANAYHAWAQLYQLSACRKHLQMANFSFDVFTGDVVRALCSGATLVMCSRDALLNPADLFDLMRREQVDCAEFVPAVLHNLVDYLEESQQTLEGMRLLVTGSESLSVREFQRVRALCSRETAIFNSYGLTETTIDSACYRAESTPPSGAQVMPIGRPLAGVSCFILDTALQPVPAGVPGELYIGGAGVGRGYVARPDLTANRFIPDPFACAPGARLYRTGDRARSLSDGTIEYLGRGDRQVKLRGFRIELGEIETALAEHNDIRASAVLARADRPGEKLLTAYIVPRAADQGLRDSLSPASLRRFLQGRLPDYMLPSAWVLLAALPVTASGKIDYRALPAPEIEPRTQSAADALSTPVEEAVARIWAELLDCNVASLDRNAHFFALGGHSLLATRVVARVRRDLQAEIPLRTLFESPTIASFAEAIVAQELAAVDDDLLLHLLAQFEEAPGDARGSSPV